MKPMRSKPEPHHWRHLLDWGWTIPAGLYGVVSICVETGVPLWAAGLVTGAGGLVATVTVMVIADPGSAAVYTAACGLATLGWVLYAMLTTPWSLPAVLSLTVASVLLLPLYPVVRGHRRALEAAARRRAEEARRLDERDKWPGLLAKVGFKGVRFLEEHETRNGRTVRLSLPSSGKVTLDSLHQGKATLKMETSARMRRGSLRFEEGEHAGEVFLNVSEKDVLAQTVPYPGDDETLTVNEPLPIGLHEDGAVCTILLREIATLIIGLRGSGKSNLLNVLIAQLARCSDAVVFMIDLKGGRTALPWIKPWLEGRTRHPVIDWVATTREEAERMLQAVKNGIDARAHSGAGGEKIIPSEGLPAVILVIEEASVIFGMGRGPKTSLEGTTNTTLAGLGTDIVQLGRSEAIDPIVLAQRGTVTMIGSGDFKSQFALRIGLGVETEMDARLIIPDDSSVAGVLARLKHPGTGIVSLKEGRPVPVKFYRMEHSQIAPLAALLGDYRVGPDAALEAALGDDYRHRWDTDRAGHIPGFQAAAARASQASQPADLTDQEFERIVAGLEDGDGDGKAVDPARKRMLEILEKKGVMGATPQSLADALETEGMKRARETISRWLKDESERGRVKNASYGRWKFVQW